MSLFCITFWGVKCLEACESALIRVVTPKDHWHEVPGWQDDRVPRGAFIALLFLTAESQGFIPLCQNLVWQGQRLFSEQATDSSAHDGSWSFSSMYLDVVIFTLVWGFHAEVAEVEFDPVAIWDTDVPHDVLVVRVWLGEVGGGEAAIQPCHFHTQRDMQEGEQDKCTIPTGQN